MLDGPPGLICKLEVQPTLGTNKSMNATQQANSIGLEPVMHPGLNHPLTIRQLLDQEAETLTKLWLYLAGRVGNDTGQEQPTGPWGWTDREIPSAECDATSGGNGTGVTNLKLGDNHTLNRSNGPGQWRVLGFPPRCGIIMAWPLILML